MSCGYGKDNIDCGGKANMDCGLSKSYKLFGLNKYIAYLVFIFLETNVK